MNHEVQLAAFQRVFPVFWEHPAVKGVTIWGYVRGFHWRNNTGAWLLYERWYFAGAIVSNGISAATSRQAMAIVMASSLRESGCWPRAA